MSDSDYPRAFVSFPRIAGSGNEIAIFNDYCTETVQEKSAPFTNLQRNEALNSVVV